jgi:hypothetical protein
MEVIMMQEKDNNLKEHEIARLKSKRMWKKAEGVRVIESWKETGHSLYQYSQQTGIGYKRLIYWKRNLRRESGPKFVEVKVKTEAAVKTGDESMEILLGNERRIRIQPGFNASSVKLLVSLLESAS